jgi:hypothetical protein
MADQRPEDAGPAPEVPPAEPAEYEEEEVEEKPRSIDPAFVYIVFVVVTLLGLSNLAVDVRYTLVWTLLTVVAVFAIALD